jgi:hypothetical protein
MSTNCPCPAGAGGDVGTTLCATRAATDFCASICWRATAVPTDWANPPACNWTAWAMGLVIARSWMRPVKAGLGNRVNAGTEPLPPHRAGTRPDDKRGGKQLRSFAAPVAVPFVGRSNDRCRGRRLRLVRQVQWVRALPGNRMHRRPASCGSLDWIRSLRTTAPPGSRDRSITRRRTNSNLTIMALPGCIIFTVRLRACISAKEAVASIRALWHRVY